MDLTVRREEYISRLEKSVSKIVETLFRLLEVERIIFLVLMLWGRWNLLTDLDILVVMDTHLISLLELPSSLNNFFSW